MRTLILIALFFSAFISNAQHPAYYVFGEEQFKGIDIYDVVQDKDLNYLFATGQGLFKHDGYSYINLECPEMKGSSVFDFQRDSEGTIYCSNLQHQIFRIKDGKMELYYELSEIDQSPDISIVVDHDENLIIQSASTIIIGPNKSFINNLGPPDYSKYSTATGLRLLPDGTTISTMAGQFIPLQKNGKIKIIEDSFSDLDSEYLKIRGLFWIVLGDKVIGISPDTHDAFEFNPETFKLKFLKKLDIELPKRFVRLYTTDNRLWLSGNSNGIYVFDQELNPLYNGESIYNDHFISDVFTDHEGNLLLSTFDEGVIVIPDNSVIGVALPDGEKITKLEPNANGILIGSNIGKVYSLNSDGKIQLLCASPKMNTIDQLYYWKEKNAIVHNSESRIEIVNLNSGARNSYLIGSLKGASSIDGNSILMAFNHSLSLWKIDSKTERLIEETTLRRGRTYSVFYDKKTKMIYLGSTVGLMLISPNGDQETVKIDGNIVYANSFMKLDDQIIIGSRKNGILIYSNDKLIRKIPFNEPIRKILVHQNKIFVLTRSGLHYAGLNEGEFTRLNQSTGLEFNNIVDFNIANGMLYITNSSKIQYVDLNSLFISQKAIPIRFIDILVNGKKAKSDFFNHVQSNFQFDFSVSTLRYRENLKYLYKLVGHQDEWHELNYDENSIEFSALPPGDYDFIVKSVNGTTESEAIHYSFTIDAPYYQKWWFYALIFIFSGLIIGLIFMYRIRKIRSKNIEKFEKQKIQTDLLESELKALRSQMNPHFIFNSLNSIQDLILKEDTDASYDYIVLFADLVRNALNYSNKDYIPVEKELDFLDVYLSLEKLRFKEDFVYNVEFEGSRDIDVPSMLIQPFIENALLHGLLHKKGKKELTIKFTFTDKLICTIEDNGIGRTKSALISDRQGAVHESFALEAINKRLQIFNERQGEEIGKYSITDLHPNQEETGTRVEIQLPFKRQY